ncbi:MAG: pyruvate kinase [Clostridiales bacterium 43-6]|nr:MAG: pyruvate kinase [Clostridiales bacterium 43-6]
MRKTKIICTLGPSTDDPNILKSLILSGMSVARLNFSHSDHAAHQERIDVLKKMRDELNMPVALLADTKGPEIRIGKFSTPKITLTEGQTFTLTTIEGIGDDKKVSISYSELPRDVSIGTRILIADGLIEMEVIRCSDIEIVCTVINGGEISSNKSINVPGIRLSMPFISSQDRADLRFAVENDFDFVAASFTRDADNILQIREELDRLNNHDIRIIAKIENSDGVSNIDSILRVSDGIMIARGDLGVEIPLEEIPVIQKKIIKKAYSAGKQVITATQMLESMIHNPRPTRAETTDIANAIYDGTSAIMLSGETAAGQYPVEAVQTMAKVAERTERDIDYKKRFRMRDDDDLCNVTDAISHATCSAAHDLSATSIITVTKSGMTARQISKYRPACTIIGCSSVPKVVRQMNLSWGVLPVHVDEKDNTDELFAHAVEVSVCSGLVKEGDLVVITAGVPLGISGTTNMMKVQVVGEDVTYSCSIKK